jgi:mRNA interferase MazF
MRRGEVWWADQPQPIGRRPVLLLSRDDAYAIRSLCTVAPISTRVRGIPSEVRLGPGDGLPRICVANLDTVDTIRQALLVRYISTLSPTKMREIETAIHYTLALSF